MELSKRLLTIAKLIQKDVNSVADIGTDHAYIPIYLIKNQICDFCIAGDINKGPLEKAKYNIKRERLDKNIICRLGSGFEVINKGEVQCAIIAGMGGDLISEIIDNDIEKFKSLKYAVVQPVQNVDVFRKYIYDKGFKILEEKICYDEHKYYEIIKIKYAKEEQYVNPIYYEVSKYLLQQKDYMVKVYIEYLIKKYDNILEYIKEDTNNSRKRKEELKNKIIELRSCLDDFNC